MKCQVCGIEVMPSGHACSSSGQYYANWPEPQGIPRPGSMAYQYGQDNLDHIIKLLEKISDQIGDL